MIKSSTATIEGYRIIEYLDIVGGAEIYMVGGLIGEGFAKQNKFFNDITKNILDKMEISARAKGADAIIGIQHSIGVVLQGQIEVTIIGTAVKVKKESIIEPIEAEKSIMSIPVTHTNIFSPICPQGVLLKTESGEISLAIGYTGKRTLKIVKAELILHSVFGEYRIESDYYFSFVRMNYGVYQSEFTVKAIPKHIIELISHADVILKEYVFDDELIYAESMELLSNEDIKTLIVEKKEEGWNSQINNSTLLLEALEQYKNAKEMLEYIESQKDKIPEELFENITKRLQKRWFIERNYGTNKAEDIRAVKKILEGE